MNKVILMGRLTRDPDIRTTGGENAMTVARYSLAVDRRVRRDAEQTADFINCVAFGKAGEFAERFLHRGTKIAVVGRIQTGSYTDNEGRKVYTTDVVVEEHHFCESANKGGEATTATADTAPRPAMAANPANASAPQTGAAGFMNIPDGIDEELPFA